MVLEGLTPGDELDNDQLCAKFMCSPQGGMRYSKRTESLVLVSNHVKSLYDDRWIGNVLHYTGMGTIGDQSLEFMQNKTLYLSNENGVAVYLFEVFQEKRYTYTGRVHLSAQPYQEIQEDVEGRERNVWIFPLKLLNAAPPVKAAILEQLAQHKAKQAKKLSVAELRKRVQSAPKIPGSQRTKTPSEVQVGTQLLGTRMFVSSPSVEPTACANCVSSRRRFHGKITPRIWKYTT